MTQIRFLRKENQPLYHNESPWIRLGKARFRCSNNVPNNPRSVRAHAFLCGSSMLRQTPPKQWPDSKFQSYQFSNPSKKQEPLNILSSNTTGIFSDSTNLKSLAPLWTHTGLGEETSRKEGPTLPEGHKLHSGAQKPSHLTLIMWTDKGKDEDSWRKTRALFEGRVGTRQVEIAAVVEIGRGG